MGDEYITTRVYTKSKRLLRKVAALREESELDTFEYLVQAEYARLVQELLADKPIDTQDADVVS